LGLDLRALFLLRERFGLFFGIDFPPGHTRFAHLSENYTWEGPQKRPSGGGRLIGVALRGLQQLPRVLPDGRFCV
jgi:hypothetical protein